jgi:hypothetical protein
MSHDQDKKCLDDSIVVDTSSAATRGQRAFAPWHEIMNGRQRRSLVCVLWHPLS